MKQLFEFIKEFEDILCLLLIMAMAVLGVYYDSLPTMLITVLLIYGVTVG